MLTGPLIPSHCYTYQDDTKTNPPWHYVTIHGMWRTHMQPAQSHQQVLTVYVFQPRPCHTCKLNNHDLWYHPKLRLPSWYYDKNHLDPMQPPTACEELTSNKQAPKYSKHPQRRQVTTQRWKVSQQFTPAIPKNRKYDQVKDVPPNSSHVPVCKRGVPLPRTNDGILWY